MNKYLILIFLAVSTVACENVDFGDTDAQVNGAVSPYPAGLLSGGIMAYATQTGRYGITVPTLYVQYQSQVTYTDEMRYADVPVSWYGYFVSSLPNFQKIIDYLSVPENITPEILLQGSKENQVGVALIMKSIVMKRVTDAYGDVPYSESLKGLDNFTPKYDDQQSIYQALIADIKKGRDMIDPSTDSPIGDIIYNGDMVKWQKLANSVIMQMTLTLSKRFPAAGGYAATEYNSALNHSAGVIETVDDEAWFKYEDKTGFTNPWNGNRTRDYFISQEFVDALNGNTAVGTLNPTSNSVYDARFEVYAKDASLPGVPYGYDGLSGKGKAQVSTANYWNNTSPLPLMTASYTWLNRAHAVALGWNATDDQVVTLEEGILLSYETLDSHFGTNVAGNAGAYAAARLIDAINFSFDQVIAEEKWVSLFGSGFDAWTEWRVTGFPVLNPATDFINDGNIPRRFSYPIEEQTLNATNYKVGVGTLTPAEDKNTARVWWDQ